MEDDEIDSQPIPLGSYSQMLQKTISSLPQTNIQCNSVVNAVKKMENGII